MLPAQAPQALASQQAPDQQSSLSEQAPDTITQVEVQQSAADPAIEEVHVRVLTSTAPVYNKVSMRCCACTCRLRCEGAYAGHTSEPPSVGKQLVLPLLCG